MGVSGGRHNLVLAPGAWSLNRTEWIEFEWTGNGPGPELEAQVFLYVLCFIIYNYIFHPDIQNAFR